MNGNLRTRIERAVGMHLRPGPETPPHPDEIAIVDSVMEVIAYVADVPARIEAQVHLNRPLPSPPELHALRADSGLTLQQVADIVGVTSSAVGQWERGVCSPQRGTAERARYLRLVEDLRHRKAAGR
jgi:DNA-binding transcriptional regulator YiaG